MRDTGARATCISPQAGLGGSWLGQVPAAYLLLRCWERSLRSVYVGVAAGYGLLCILLSVALACLDWEAVSAEAQARARPTAGSGMPPVHVQEERADAQAAGGDDATTVRCE